MTPADLAALHARCFTLPRPWSADEFAALLAQDSTILATRPQGFALIRVVLDEAELLTIAVDPDHRRTGLGRDLLSVAENAAKGRGARRCFLDVGADNAAAIALYRSAGYAESGRRRGYYRLPGQPPIDALVLSRQLGGG